MSSQSTTAYNSVNSKGLASSRQENQKDHHSADTTLSETDTINALPRIVTNNLRHPPNRGSARRSSVGTQDDSDTPGESFRHRRTPSSSTWATSAVDQSQRLRTQESLISMVDTPPEGPAPGRITAFYQKNRGLAYVLVAQVFGTLMNVTTRLLEKEGNRGQGMHPFQILFVRMSITVVLSVIYMWWANTPHWPLGLPEVRWLLALRGMGSFFGVFGMYYSLLYLALADATVLTFISPSISCFACSILIKEPFTRMEQMGALVSFFGVALIARPSAFFHHGGPPAEAGGVEARNPASDFDNVTPAQRFSAICVALIGVLGQAAAFTAMRWIGKRAHPILSVNYFSVWCMVVSALAMTVLPDIGFILPATPKEWGYLLFLGFCGFSMQFLLSAGLQLEKSSRATNMVYTQMLFALIFDKLVFGTNPSVLSLLGSSMILGSAIYVAMQKESIKQRQEAEKSRQESSRSSGRIVELVQQRPSATYDEDSEHARLMASEEGDGPGPYPNGESKGTQ